MLATQTMMQLGCREPRAAAPARGAPGTLPLHARLLSRRHRRGRAQTAKRPRLRTIVVGNDAACVGKTLGSLNLAPMDVQVTAVRRKGARELIPRVDRDPARRRAVLLGTQGNLARAEIRLLQGEQKNGPTSAGR